MGDYKILRGQLLSEKATVETYIICGPGLTHNIKLQPVKFFQRRYYKKAGPVCI
jgi:hypothetical protein